MCAQMRVHLEKSSFGFMQIAIQKRHKKLNKKNDVALKSCTYSHPVGNYYNYSLLITLVISIKGTQLHIKEY